MTTLRSVLQSYVSNGSVPGAVAQIALDDPSGTGCRSWRRRLFGPLGMADTGFEVSAGKLDRLTSYYRTDPAGGVELVDAPDGQWSGAPAFPSGAGGLVSTADDWHCFAKMLLAGGRQLLSGRRCGR